MKDHPLTPYQTPTHPKWMFSQKLLFKSSFLLNGYCGIQVCPPNNSDDICLLFCIYPSYMTNQCTFDSSFFLSLQCWQTRRSCIFVSPSISFQRAVFPEANLIEVPEVSNVDKLIKIDFTARWNIPISGCWSADEIQILSAFVTLFFIHRRWQSWRSWILISWWNSISKRICRGIFVFIHRRWQSWRSWMLMSWSMLKRSISPRTWCGPSTPAERGGSSLNFRLGWWFFPGDFSNFIRVGSWGKGGRPIKNDVLKVPFLIQVNSSFMPYKTRSPKCQCCRSTI